ncbi:bifunctional alpha/beta hydrolase/OsmC family protein [Arthrobacter sp. H35-D1]|uniref:bifunctional alpha/beta hydrolase/OsmC family protein n=1 Tax=Arthrobacter sp. H35-D1 TaxID=3046202 RepID=UPI0024B98F9A|nr:bifunctional alpha/beta hydrolase/OsmC family protein [Arthrobacter sp. H35-D1]MDJ0314642.1 alpha/beta fold hydrolase [Arthrobacter sp. H35-D1]
MSTSNTCTFTGDRGHQLSARLERPDGPIRGSALFAHCFTCSKDLRVERQLTQALAEQGYAVLSFDFAGLGRSGGDFADSSFSADVADLRAAARYLSETVAAPALLVGHSLGGAAVISAAPDLPSVRAVATIGAPADTAHVLGLLDGDLDAVRRVGSAPVTIGGRTFTVGRSFLDDLEQGNPRDRIAEFDGATMILHAPLDALVGIENAELLYRAARHPKSFVSLDDADHLLTKEADAHYTATVIAAWAERYLPVTPEGIPGAEILGGGVSGAGGEGYNVAGATARNGGGFVTRLESRGFVLAADEPSESGGTETGPTPYDYLAMALASCTAMTMRVYADRKGWQIGELDAHVQHDRIHASDCRECEHSNGRIDRLHRTLELPEDLSDDQRDALVRIADRCPVHLTLEGQIEVHTTLRSPGSI